MRLIYHLSPVDEYKSVPPDQPYQPGAFAQDGFIHCTRGAEQLVIVANRYYQNDLRPLAVVVIDESRVTAEIKYEPGQDDGVLYPHIYGLLNRDAIVTVLNMGRLPDGSFQFPDRYETRT
jgi:uncharacterized protein (DUF952 family)